MPRNKACMNKRATYHVDCSCLHPPPLRLCLLGLNGKCSMGEICAFFGHRDTPMTDRIEKDLTDVIRKLIFQGVDEFWLGEQGAFDYMSRLVLKNLKKEYRWIAICIFPTRLPSKAKMKWLDEQKYEIIYPEEVAKAPFKVALLRRNQYMVKYADNIVCYITREHGGAYKAVKQAQKMYKNIINLAEDIY